MSLSIGVDVGGTKIAAGVVDEDGNVITRVQKDSPANDRDAILATIIEVALDLKLAHPEATTVGIGAAGFVSSDRNTMASGTNLDWTGVKIGDVVSEGVGLPVVVENDANAAGWAEARFGAGAGKANVLVVTLGTGVGGAVVIDGHLVRGAAGFAAEIGHISIVPDGRPCGCGLRGCLERYASGTALGVNGWELAKFRPAYAARIIELSGGDQNKISGKAVTAAAREGDPAALECYERLGDALGQGLADLAAVLDPEVIVLTGGLTEAGDILLTPVTKAFDQYLTARTRRPQIPVLISASGQDAGLVGAADLARAV
ncbi:MAG: ROK family glucokinase [Actinomyces urogenitalis]|uniref:Glucokinase n=5 Tax=root TaxID=1 RepID=C0W5B5_9ACTO|nr:ROK family glucokinase [Actinomyces urogenitalis]EEH66095.1 ROK family protein [Actinomyces urogenitalis DSM 15434]KGF02927.1 glucokinase [Actinomyces urogenitalis S6-C4]MBS5977380.1 ROK family glucokinase [Actinomyces urogenitalis]MBS6071844.1 ROK family glucokinase [Actinomyces urogenitalis]MDK8238140.1 ROK family glucokinase [Actinomyces urogenitalis]